MYVLIVYAIHMWVVSNKLTINEFCKLLTEHVPRDLVMMGECKKTLIASLKNITK